MDCSDIAAAIDEALAGRRLLEHPYYRAWENGELSIEDLGRYAEQYRHFEQALPQVLDAIVEHLPDGPARQLVLDNLLDERGRPEAHVDLFERFAAAVRARSGAAPSSATRRLIGLYRSAAHADPAAGLAVVAAYEAQAAAVAATKAGALARHHHLDPAGTEFWTVHADMEHDHADWTTAAIVDLDADRRETREWAGRSAQAWWDFLDERDAERAA